MGVVIRRRNIRKGRWRRRVMLLRGGMVGYICWGGLSKSGEQAGGDKAGGEEGGGNVKGGMCGGGEEG